MVTNFPRLERLEGLAQKYPAYDFSSTILVAIQHLLGTNGSLLELLNRLGLPYEQMYLLGKIYSTNESVYEELKRRGAYVHPSSISQDTVQLTADYKLNLAKAADEMLTAAITKLETLKSPRTLLVVDDGGVLVGRVNDHMPTIDARVVGVEQTRSGAEMVRALHDLKFPIINVAESKIKLQDESPYIATSIIQHVLQRVSRLPNPKLPVESDVLIVGHGAIGRNVAAQLRPLVRKVEIHDVIDLQDVAVIRDFERAVHGKAIVIGCVGKSWLPERCRDILPRHVILASGSSSNSEFLGLKLDTDQYTVPPVQFQKSDLLRAHSDYSFNDASGWVLNAGFPVNFDGSVDPIAPETIELTRMLMLDGILQTLTVNAKPGLHVHSTVLVK